MWKPSYCEATVFANVLPLYPKEGEIIVIIIILRLNCFVHHKKRQCKKKIPIKLHPLIVYQWGQFKEILFKKRQKHGKYPILQF